MWRIHELRLKTWICCRSCVKSWWAFYFENYFLFSPFQPSKIYFNLSQVTDSSKVHNSCRSFLYLFWLCFVGKPDVQHINRLTLIWTRKQHLCTFIQLLYWGTKSKNCKHLKKYLSRCSNNKKLNIWTFLKAGIFRRTAVLENRFH